MTAGSKISLKRVYAPPAKSDGARVLVDRLWPRALTKQDAHLKSWLRDLAPSNELRKWYHAHLDEWTEFRRRYLRELRGPETATAIEHLKEIVSQNDHVTLVFASKELEQNNAAVLKEFFERWCRS